MIIEKTGWKRSYVLWGIRWINLQLMIGDAPTVGKKGKKKLSGKQAIARHKARNAK